MPRTPSRRCKNTSTHHFQGLQTNFCLCVDATSVNVAIQGWEKRAVHLAWITSMKTIYFHLSETPEDDGKGIKEEGLNFLSEFLLCCLIP